MACKEQERVKERKRISIMFTMPPVHIIIIESAISCCVAFFFSRFYLILLNWWNVRSFLCIDSMRLFKVNINGVFIENVSNYF